MRSRRESMLDTATPTERKLMEKKEPKKDYKKISIELAKRVKWALAFMRSSRGGMVFLGVGAEPEVIDWETWFMDGLDMVDYKIDRKKYFAKKDKKRGRA